MLRLMRLFLCQELCLFRLLRPPMRFHIPARTGIRIRLVFASCQHECTKRRDIFCTSSHDNDPTIASSKSDTTSYLPHRLLL